MPPLTYIILISHILFTRYMIFFLVYCTISCNILHIFIHQNAQWMHDLNLCPSSPRYLYTYAMILRCDAPNPGGHFFFWLPDKFVTIENLYRDRTTLSRACLCRVHALTFSCAHLRCCCRASVMRTSQPCAHACRACPTLLWPT